MALTLEPGDIHVHYRVTDELCVHDDPASLAVLSSDERERAQRFAHARDRVTFVAAHGLLRRTLSRYAAVPPESWTFIATAHGKPVLGDSFADLNLKFNLAHTHGLVSCVVSRGSDVGIDAESVTGPVEDVLPIAVKHFAPAEVAALEQCREFERRVRFTELWTLKEAFVKCVGTGLSHPLDTFLFEWNHSAEGRFEPPPDIQQTGWEFALLAPSERHRLAVAVRLTVAKRCRIEARSAEGESPRLLCRLARR
jgi:4'-phosphopantetheinyl transferase